MNNISDSIETTKQLLGSPTVKELSLWKMLFGGGIAGTAIMVILFILLIVTIYIFFERYFIIKKASKIDSDFMNTIRDFVHEGKIESGLDLCRYSSAPEAKMIEKGLMRIGRPLEDISQAIENEAKLQIYNLEKRLNTMATIAGAAPMLGFLGTVVGVIIVFFNITHAAGGNINPQDLAGGLFTAMGTTAAGLVVGIAAYIGYNYLVSKVDNTVYLLQVSAVNFLDLINKPA